MGHSSWNFLKLLNLAVEGITSFSIAPLRIATVCGVLCSISSFIYAIYFLIKTVLYGDETAFGLLENAPHVLSYNSQREKLDAKIGRAHV